jgi:hypothetical protein
MKKNSSFFLTRWWQALELQKRLLVTFTVLFLYSALLISLFLNMSVGLLRMNAETRAVFEQNRNVNQLFRLTKQFEVALNFYEFNGSEPAAVELYSDTLQINDQLRVLATSLSGEDLNDLRGYQENKTKLDANLDQVIEAVDEWTLLYYNEASQEELSAQGEVIDALDSAAYEILRAMEGQLENITSRGLDQTARMDAENAAYQTGMLISFLVGIPLFLFLAGMVTLVIHGQINQPLGQISKAARDLLEGSFRPEQLQALAGREDEIGLMAREFVDAAGLVVQREAQLAQEAGEIRAKIR